MILFQIQFLLRKFFIRLHIFSSLKLLKDGNLSRILSLFKLKMAYCFHVDSQIYQFNFFIGLIQIWLHLSLNFALFPYVVVLSICADFCKYEIMLLRPTWLHDWRRVGVILARWGFQIRLWRHRQLYQIVFVLRHWLVVINDLHVRAILLWRNMSWQRFQINGFKFWTSQATLTCISLLRWLKLFAWPRLLWFSLAFSRRRESGFILNSKFVFSIIFSFAWRVAMRLNLAATSASSAGSAPRLLNRSMFLNWKLISFCQ